LCVWLNCFVNVRDKNMRLTYEEQLSFWMSRWNGPDENKLNFSEFIDIVDFDEQSLTEAITVYLTMVGQGCAND
jgi:hypothetical protein